MEYIIAFSQLVLFTLFLFTLKCELSKRYSDSIVFVSLRTFIMCASAIIFFMLFESKYHNLLSLTLLLVPTLLGTVYTILETLSTNKIKYQKGIYNDPHRS